MTTERPAWADHALKREALKIEDRARLFEGAGDEPVNPAMFAETWVDGYPREVQSLALFPGEEVRSARRSLGIVVLLVLILAGVGWLVFG